MLEKFFSSLEGLEDVGVKMSFYLREFRQYLLVFDDDLMRKDRVEDQIFWFFYK